MYVTFLNVIRMWSEGDAPQMENQQLVSPARKRSSITVGFGK